MFEPYERYIGINELNVSALMIYSKQKRKNGTKIFNWNPYILVNSVTKDDSRSELETYGGFD